MLTKLRKPDILKPLFRINKTQTAADAFASLNRSSSDVVQRSVQAGVADADSIQARYTLLLVLAVAQEKYPRFLRLRQPTPEKASLLLRRHGGKEAVLSAPVTPDKQHIVPYKILRRLFELEGGGRPGRHPVNDIGNITYISRGLNSFVTGVGSKPLRLKARAAIWRAIV